MPTRLEGGGRAVGRPGIGVARTRRQRASKIDHRCKDTPSYWPRQSWTSPVREVQVQDTLSFLLVGENEAQRIPRRPVIEKRGELYAVTAMMSEDLRDLLPSKCGTTSVRSLQSLRVT